MSDIEWKISPGVIDYGAAVTAMEERVAAIRCGAASEQVWFLEHPPLYTAGTSSKAADLIDSGTFPVYATGRGGQYTYHGPGQRVGYVMLDLRQRARDVRAFVYGLEAWIIAALARFNVVGQRRDGRVGIWVALGGGREAKIAAVGVRVRHWVTYHGFSLNVDPNLAHFGGIVPCGVREHGVTSLVDLGIPVVLSEVDAALRVTFGKVFG